jgi:hypothetical protein
MYLCIMSWRYMGDGMYCSIILYGGEWSASRPGHFIPRERVPGTHWMGGWVDPRKCLDTVVKRNIFCPFRKLNIGSPTRSPSLYRLSNLGSPLTRDIVIYSVLLTSVRQLNDGLCIRLELGETKYLQDFSSETFWKETTWKQEREREGDRKWKMSINKDHRKAGCGDRIDSVSCSEAKFNVR